MNERMRCGIRTRRHWEVLYMIEKNDDKTSALAIIFEGLNKLLCECRIGQERIINMDERASITKHLLDDFNPETIKEEKKRRNRVEYLEKEIEKLEARMKAIEAVLSAPKDDDDIMELTREYLECKRELDAKTEEWGELLD